MTTPRAHFDDIRGKRFDVPAEMEFQGIVNALVFERGTRSFGKRLFEAGYRHYRDLNNISVSELIRDVPTTRPNLDRALHYLCRLGVTLA